MPKLCLYDLSTVLISGFIPKRVFSIKLANEFDFGMAGKA